MQKILILAANPKDTDRLRLDEELREIDEGLRRAKHRDQFDLCQKHAVRSRDVRRAMLDEVPQIVHFSGYGSAAAGLIFEDEQGRSQPASQESLANLIELFADPDEFEQPISCVVLNGCYSPEQAAAIAQHIPYVIGLTQTIDNQQRIEFAVGLYDALGAGRSVEFAFKFARSAYDMAGNPDESAVPVLVKGVPAVHRPSPKHPAPTPEPSQTASQVPAPQYPPAPRRPFNTQLWRRLGITSLVALPLLLVGYWQGSRVLAAQFYARGEQQYFDGDTNAARANFKRAIQFNAGLAEAHHNLGLIHEDEGDFDRAREAYTQAKDAGSLGALNNLARLEIVEFEDYPIAAQMLLGALQNPQRDQSNTALEYSLRKNLGWALLEQGPGQLGDAEDALTEANRLEAQLGDSRPDSYCLLAQVYEQQSKPDAAIEQWQTCRRKISRPEDNVWKGLANEALSDSSASEPVIE
ncbi:MAG: tetratricopeptide repeat protein [Cyanobacteria bacterium J06648_11]